MTPKRSLATIVAFLALAAAVIASAITDREIKQGNAMYQTALHEGHIVQHDSTTASAVEPIAAKLFPILQKSYGAPFSVVIVRAGKGEAPDAYTLIGPRISIDTAFPGFIKNRDALAGVMCHEANHVLHHDALRSKKTAAGGAVASSLAQHTRGEEERADIGAVSLCAQVTPSAGRPSTRSGSRLVATIVAGVAPTSSCTKRATAAMRCSQLSSTSTSAGPAFRKASTIAASTDAALVSGRRSADAVASATRARRSAAPNRRRRIRR